MDVVILLACLYLSRRYHKQVSEIMNKIFK